jgi:ribosomal protein S18 acetylase RimI-like enzyme
MEPSDDLLKRLADQSPAAQGAAPDKPFRWVPIRSLAERHRSRIEAHLLALGERDRYLRFGYAAGDEQIRRYVERIDFNRDELFGIFNRRLVLIAMSHLAFSEDGPDRHCAEFGVSVLPSTRGRGYGARLFDHAVLHARNRGVDTLVIHALSENTAMLHIVRQAGAAVVRDGGEAEARLQLPPEDFASRWGEAVEDGAAELDYRWKLHTQQVDSFMDTLAEARAQASASRPPVE